MFKKIVAAICACIVMFAVGKHFLSSTKKSNQELVQIMADAINKDAPRVVDDVRVEKAIAKDNELMSNYTLINANPGEIDKKVFRDHAYPNLLKQGCSNNEMSAALNAGIILSYAYHDNQGGEILYVQLTKEVCTNQ